MELAVIFGIVAVGAALVAIVMGMQVSGARAQASSAKGEIESVRSRLAALEAESKKASEALDAKRKESEELKEKLKDLKKRRHEEKESARLKQDIQTAREEIEREMEKKLQSAREDAEISKAHVKKLTAEVEQLKSRRQERAPAAEPRPEAPKVEIAAAPLVPRQATPEEVKRAEEAEKAAAQARRKVDEAHEEVKKARSRAETDRRVFLVQKAEVEVVKDKFRAIEAKANALVLEREELKKAVWLLEKELKSLRPTPDPKSLAEAKKAEAKPAEAPKAEDKPAPAAALAAEKPAEEAKA
ncbi:MAG: hypothetical protein HY901_06440 [Deltaproteobacteria bacterium]|nr:hypothetical protein [Deltaproteobacteria bacterium]